jgi:hemerythrin
VNRVNIIKHQHKTIENIIYCLEDFIVKREKSKFCPENLIKNLIFLIKPHFENENKILSDLEYSTEHINDHKYLVLKLEEILKLKKIEVESIIFLKKWIKNHKSKYDSVLIDYLNENVNNLNKKYI